MSPVGGRASARVKHAVFALVPAAALLVGLEVVCRLAEVARPRLHSLPLPEEKFGALEPDPDLFWRPKPNLRMRYAGADAGLVTNALGLRGGDVGPKAQGELRILSLGESTTFGDGVTNERTYSARLEAILRADRPGLDVRVLNAGVPAWSSYQSLQYLKLRGLDLRPDLVLFYHEVNDYLPSSVRDSSNDEIGLTLSDWQLHDSLRGSLSRRLLAHSALARVLGYWAARRSLARLERRGPAVTPGTIGIPSIGVPPRVVSGAGAAARPLGMDEHALPRRVTAEERRKILAELAATCRDHGAALVVIHPSYRPSVRHECELTEFCRSHRVPMLEAYDLLHPDGGAALFQDSMHPSPEGHEALARGLARFLEEGGFLAGAEAVGVAPEHQFRPGS